MKKFLIILLCVILVPIVLLTNCAIVIGLLSVGIDSTETTVETSLSEEAVTETLLPEETTAPHEHDYTVITHKATWQDVEHIISTCKDCGHQERNDIGQYRKIPIQFTYKSYEKDYCGGVTLNFSVKNLTEKPIKYITFHVTFLNAVGDAIPCTIDYKYTHVWTITGPLKANASVKYRPTGFYNETFKGTIRVHDVSIIFMDDSSLTIDTTLYDCEKLVK